MKLKHKSNTLALLAATALLSGVVSSASAEIGIISPEEARKLIETPDPVRRPIVLDTRGGYKDYFRSHLPTAHHINFDTLRGTDHAVPVRPFMKAPGRNTCGSRTSRCLRRQPRAQQASRSDLTYLPHWF